MAFPQTAAPTATPFAASSTAHDVAMPGTVNAGDLLLMLFSITKVAAAPATPSGWSLLYDLILGAGTGDEALCYVKVADGTEGGTTVDVNTAPTSTEATAQVYRITDWYGTLAGVEAGAGNDAQSGTAPDPSSVTPSWGAEDNLWIAACHARNDAANVTGFPTTYGNGVSTIADGGANDGSTTGSARKEANASTDDPDAFTLDASEEWAANTIVIRPAMAGGGTNFAQVSDTLTQSFITASTTHNVTMPSTVDAGDLLKILFALNTPTGVDVTLSNPAGWTLLWSQHQLQVRGACWVKVADGSEDSTNVNIVSSAAETAAVVVQRITSWFGDLAGVEVGTVFAQSNVTAPNPPALTTSWGTRENLWFADVCGGNDAATVTSYPAGYDDNQTEIQASGAPANARPEVYTASKDNEVSTENPGTFIISAGEELVSNTMAVRPAADVSGAVVTHADTLLIHSPPTVEFEHDFTMNQAVEFEDEQTGELPFVDETDGLLLGDSVTLVRSGLTSITDGDSLLLDVDQGISKESGGEVPLTVSDDADLLLRDAVSVSRITPSQQLGLTDVPQYYVRAGFITPSWTEVNSTYASDWTKLAGASSWEDLSGGPVPDIDVLRVAIDRGLGDSFDRLPVGNATFLLDNMNEDYSPEKNARVRPNAILSIKAATLDGDSNTQSWFPLYTGYLRTISTDPALETNRQIALRCEDRAKQIKNKTSNTSLQVQVRANSLFTQTFRSSGFDDSKFIVDGRMSDEFSFAWLDDIPLGDAITDQLRAGAHFIFCDQRGRFRVRDRNFDVFPPVDQTSSDQFLAFRYTLDDRNVINRARIGGQPRVIATDQATIAWLRETDLKASSGDNLEFTISYRDPVTEEQPTPCTSIVAPVQGTDWYLNTEADGVGTDMSSAATLTFQSFATTGKITLAYAGNREAFISKLQVRGTPLRKQPTTIALSVNDSSIEQYDEQKLDLESDLIPNYFLSQAYADFAVKRFSAPEGKIEFARKDEWPEILTTDLMSFVTAVNTYAGVNSSYLIDNVRHDIALARGIEHTVVYGGRLSAERDYLVLDNDPLGQLDVRKLAF